MSVIPPFFLNCVVALGNRDSAGNVRWTASGFLYGSLVEEPPEGWGEGGKRYNVFLVTNKHVVAGLTDAVARMETTSGEDVVEVPIGVTDDDGTDLWAGHPDPEVDVAVTYMNLEALEKNQAAYNFFSGDDHSATLAELQALGVNEGQSGFVLGFPMSLVGGPINAVIVRSAVIARIRDAYMGTEKDFLVDGTVFPGNSGGPAVVRPELVAIEGTSPLAGAYLVGVVSSYVAYTDVAVSQQTGNPRIAFEENSGLTRVVPVDRIDEAIAILIAHHGAARGADEGVTLPDEEVS